MFEELLKMLEGHRVVRSLPYDVVQLEDAKGAVRTVRVVQDPGSHRVELVELNAYELQAVLQLEAATLERAEAARRAAEADQRASAAAGRIAQRSRFYERAEGLGAAVLQREDAAAGKRVKS